MYKNGIMLIKNKLINEVSSFSISEHFYLVNTINNKTLLNNEEIFSDIEKKNLRIYFDKLLFYSKNKIIYDYNLKELYSLLNEETFLLSNNSIYILTYIINDNYGFDYSKLYKFDNKKKLLCDFKVTLSNIQLIFNSYIFIYNETIIQAFSIDENKFIWQFNLSKSEENIDIFRIIGIWKQLLFFIVNDKILSIDIETGKLLNQWQAKNEASATMAKDEFPSGIKLDADTGKLLHPYMEIDIQSNEYKNLDVLSQLEISQKEEFTIYPNTGFTFNEKYLFISATQDSWIHKGKPPKSTCHLFAINRKTGKQEWHHKLDTGKKYKAVKKMETTDNKLYVLDHGNTLHIFERENA